ncbi:MAG: universal stress protein [Actinomycetia bacterium]|nr:universal stress protein [Actinomycetes bacterium]
MRIVIGVTPDDSGSDALAIGAMLCTSFGAEPVLAHIYPAAYEYVSQGHVDAEWQRYLREQAEALVAEAAEEISESHGFEAVATTVHGHRSSGKGLIEVAQATGADVIAIGSAPGASNGRFQIGSTADQLLHGSHVPVAMAPASLRRSAEPKFSRILAAFQNTHEAQNAAMEAARMAQRAELPLQLITVLQKHRIYGSALGRSAESAVIEEQTQQTQENQAAVIAKLPAELDVSARIAVGDTIATALGQLSFDSNELLVLASSRGGAVRRVFLGDVTYKLIRSAPVPMVVLPRRT